MSGSLRSRIPWPYTLFHLYIEPTFAFLGSLQASFLPIHYLTFFVQEPITTVSPHLQIALDQVAGCYTLFAFNEAILLRMTDDLRVWKTVLAGIALCDIVHLCGSRRALGPDIFWNPALWTAKDWVNMGLLWIPLAMRICFVLGIGIRKDARIRLRTGKKSA